MIKKRGPDFMDVYSTGMKKAVMRLDGWMNSVTGLGTSRDKQTAARFVGNGSFVLSDDTADMLYSEDDVASRICDAFPDYALRSGIRIRVSPDYDQNNLEDELAKKEEIEATMKSELRRLDTINRITKCGTWANVFGAGVILMGVDDGNLDSVLSEPLNEDNIKEIKHLTVFDKRYVQPSTWYRDPKEAKFGDVETYTITSTAGDLGSLNVHESRLLVFNGTRTTVTKMQSNGGWDSSLLSRCYNVVRQFGMSWETLTHLINDAGQAVFKMSGYIDAIASDDEGVIETRMALLDKMRSVVRALVLDADSESFERQPFQWGGISEPFELLMYRLSLASRVPVALIMGRSPAGENATGEADWENFDAQVEGYREINIEPLLSRLIYLLFKAKQGPFGGKEPDNWEIEFGPLRAITPKQKAEIRALNTTADVASIGAGILTPEEVSIARYGPDSDSEISIDIESRINPPEDELEAVNDISNQNVVEGEDQTSNASSGAEATGESSALTPSE